MEKKIIDIVKRVSRGFDEKQIKTSKNFFTDGIIDSLGLINLIAELEQAFDIDLMNDELDFEELSSIIKIRMCIDRY